MAAALPVVVRHACFRTLVVAENNFVVGIGSSAWRMQIGLQQQRPLVPGRPERLVQPSAYSRPLPVAVVAHRAVEVCQKHSSNS